MAGWAPYFKAEKKNVNIKFYTIRNTFQKQKQNKDSTHMQKLKEFLASRAT